VLVFGAGCALLVFGALVSLAVGLWCGLRPVGAAAATCLRHSISSIDGRFKQSRFGSHSEVLQQYSFYQQ